MALTVGMPGARQTEEGGFQTRPYSDAWDGKLTVAINVMVSGLPITRYC